MCEHCLSYPHKRGCPGKKVEPPKVVYECEYCGEPIREGQEQCEILGEHYHVKCAEEAFDIWDILEIFGITKEEA